MVGNSRARRSAMARSCATRCATHAISESPTARVLPCSVDLGGKLGSFTQLAAQFANEVKLRATQLSAEMAALRFYLQSVRPSSPCPADPLSSEAADCSGCAAGNPAPHLRSWLRSRLDSSLRSCLQMLAASPLIAELAVHAPVNWANSFI
jgi:hypothetical protein